MIHSWIEKNITASQFIQQIFLAHLSFFLLYLYIYLENLLGKYLGKCTEIGWHIVMILTFINFCVYVCVCVWKFVTVSLLIWFSASKEYYCCIYIFVIVRISASWSDGPLLIEDVESKFGLLLSTNTLWMSVLESLEFWFQNLYHIQQ